MHLPCRYGWLCYQNITFTRGLESSSSVVIQFDPNKQLLPVIYVDTLRSRFFTSILSTRNRGLLLLSLLLAYSAGDAQTGWQGEDCRARG